MFKFLNSKNVVMFIFALLVLVFSFEFLACLADRQVFRLADAAMKSSDFELQMPNLNFAAGSVSSTGFKLGFTGGELAVGPYSSTGYRLLAGFWYLKTIIPFSFSVSNNLVEFGTLSSGVPATATTDLTVSAGGAGGYQVTAEENHQVTDYTTGALIPDTTGDNGDISESVAGTWALNTTYGFGYTLHGNDVPAPFPAAAPAGNNYKQFTDTAKSETPQVVMSSANVGKNRTSTITYKINISASQPAGRYHNVITYIATPAY